MTVLDFRNDLSKLLKKYNVELCSRNEEDLFFKDEDGNLHPLIVNPGCGYASYHNIGAEEKPKRERKRKVKNPLRRWIYEYERYNPQLGTSIRTSEVYAKTQKQAEKEARRSCNSYNSYGSLCFKRMIKVSDPIVENVDVKLEEHTYYGTGNTYFEYKDLYPKQHSEGWDKLTAIA